MVTLKLTDPAGGKPWRIQRRLLRTFPTMQACETQKESFIGFHVGQVERHGLITASGAAPVVEVESIECFTVPRGPLRTVAALARKGGGMAATADISVSGAAPADQKSCRLTLTAKVVGSMVGAGIFSLAPRKTEHGETS
jgi:hypothetical protein